MMTITNLALVVLLAAVGAPPAPALAFFSIRPSKPRRKAKEDSFQDAESSSSSTTKNASYHVVVIGAGAAGMFAGGTASSFGQETALIDANPISIGGDCTNAACVPSKALRSIAQQQQQAAQYQQAQYQQAQQAAQHPSSSSSTSFSWRDVQTYLRDTVLAVRQRDNGHDMQARNPRLDWMQGVHSCKFVSPHELHVVLANRTALSIASDKFVIATGASPIVPSEWKEQAATVTNQKMPLFTYRSVLGPEWNDEFFDFLMASTTADRDDSQNNTTTTARRKTLAIIGGGATACELGQALARLSKTMMATPQRLDIVLIAPSILPEEDDELRESAQSLLLNEGIEIIHDRLVHIHPNQTLQLQTSQGTALLQNRPVDALLVCIGRSPRQSLAQLELDRAGIRWQGDEGIVANPRTLQSVTAPHVYAVGDACSAVTSRSRTASHAAWTGFHAIRNAVVPWVLRIGSKTSIHPVVPRVIYTDPELACVGLTRRQCEEKYGHSLGSGMGMDEHGNSASEPGFDSVMLREEGSDRADMERSARNTSVTFLELRVQKVTGKILGFTCCSPAAAEMANGMAMALTHGWTVRHVAKSLHSYPSHGYLLHRVALAMALSDVCGLLEACGPVGAVLARIARTVRGWFWMCRCWWCLWISKQVVKARSVAQWDKLMQKLSRLSANNGDQENKDDSDKDNNNKDSGSDQQPTATQVGPESGQP